jgi:small-conductance mechanosensitive channel
VDAAWWAVLALACVAALLGWLGIRLLDAIGRRSAKRAPVLNVLRLATHRPANVLAPLLAVAVVMSSASDQLDGIIGARRLITVSIVVVMTWLLMKAVGAVSDIVSVVHPASDTDNLSARRLQTQTQVLTRVMAAVIALLGVAMALMTFPQVRHVGASLLASAGLAGIVAGLAARPLLGNLIAGLQIGLTQPIRLDDVVIVQGEWGRIEEINGTYVVVRLWDERRLVVPLEWWTQNPFQNWTRTSSNILGTVFLWVDYRMPVAPLRAELQRFCHDQPNWDGRVCELVVTESTERAMQLRCLISSRDSGQNWALRCAVREHMVNHIQATMPDYLPQIRTTWAPSETLQPGYPAAMPLPQGPAGGQGVAPSGGLP